MFGLFKLDNIFYIQRYIKKKKKKKIFFYIKRKKKKKKKKKLFFSKNYINVVQIYNIK